MEYAKATVHMPEAFESILKCLETHSPYVSWTLTNSKGVFSMKVWQTESPAKDITCPRQSVKTPDRQKPGKSSKRRKVDLSTAADKPGTPGENLEPPHSPRKRRKKKTPYKIRRDRKRLQIWKQLRKNNPSSEVCDSPRSLATDQEQSGSDHVSQQQPSCPEVELENCRSDSDSLSHHSNESLDSDDTDTSSIIWDIGTCSFCHKEAGPGPKLSLRSCTKCRLVAYCSQTCQKVDWPMHKELCLTFQKPEHKEA